VTVTLALRLAPSSKLPALLVFVAPAEISTGPVVADASMSVRDEWTLFEKACHPTLEIDDARYALLARVPSSDKI
jgi:hypothetical protein